MKIATWNVERPIRTTQIEKIEEVLSKLDPDILVLTETNDRINIGDSYSVFHTTELPGDFYKPGERRASIYSKYPSGGSIATYDPRTALCVKLDTPLGELCVYATVIGVYGNRHEGFEEGLDKQINDFKSISQVDQLCIAGDLNMTFADNYYFTKSGRNKLLQEFEELQLQITTANIPHNIDHIVLPAQLATRARQPEQFIEAKVLSDHMGVCVSII